MALNELNGQGHLDPRHRPSEAQFASLARLSEAVEHDSPPPECPTPQAALSELLGSRADSYGPALAKVATYRSDLVSCPASVGRASLVDCLPPYEWSLLTTESHRLFASPEHLKELRPPKVFWDSTLRSDVSCYNEFVQQLHSRNMVQFRHSVWESVGIFFVHKTSGMLRMVVDARRTNCLLVMPPRTRLASTAAVVEYVAHAGEKMFF